MKQRSNITRRTCAVVSLLTLVLLGACHDKTQDASMGNFTAAVNGFLAKRGHLCLAKYDWPIYVTTEDQANQTRDAIQMPVLEKLGLVIGKDMEVEGTDNGKEIHAQARQYSLTDEGKKYYLQMPEVVATATKRVTHPADFCAATLTLDKVVGWEAPVQRDGETVTSVLYTYKIEPFPWAKDSEAQRVFPWVKRTIEGAGTMQLREGMHLTKQGWVADEIFRQ
jgi:hypothetical protein